MNMADVFFLSMQFIFALFVYFLICLAFGCLIGVSIKMRDRQRPSGRLDLPKDDSDQPEPTDRD